MIAVPDGRLSSIQSLGLQPEAMQYIYLSRPAISPATSTSETPHGAPSPTARLCDKILSIPGVKRSPSLGSRPMQHKSAESFGLEGASPALPNLNEMSPAMF